MTIFRKTLHGFAVILFGVTCLIGPATGEDFEGIIHSRGFFNDGARDFTMFFKGNKARIELVGKNVTVPVITIYDMDSRVQIKLLMDRKIAREIALKGLEMVPESAASTRKKTKSIFRTDETEIIAGFPAVKTVIVREDETIMEVWMTKEIQISKDLFNGMIEFASAATYISPQDKDLVPSFLPLRRSMKKGGFERLDYLVTSVEKTSLNPSLFTVPPDYKVIRE